MLDQLADDELVSYIHSRGHHTSGTRLNYLRDHRWRLDHMPTVCAVFKPFSRGSQVRLVHSYIALLLAWIRDISYRHPEAAEWRCREDQSG
ncbi:MAG: hypothetical protein ACRET7_02280 [Burkholderiales bacterium]